MVKESIILGFCMDSRKSTSDSSLASVICRQMSVLHCTKKGHVALKKYLSALADISEVSPHALAIPDIDSYVGLMHTLFALESLYGLHIGEINMELCLRFDKTMGATILSMFDIFHE